MILLDVMAAMVTWDWPAMMRKWLKALEWKISPIELVKIPLPMLMALEWRPANAAGLPSHSMTLDEIIEFARAEKERFEREAAEQ